MGQTTATETATEGGAYVAGNATGGRDMVGRDRRSSSRRGNETDSHDIIIRLDEANRDLSLLNARMLEMAVDVKLLQNMSQERGEQIKNLQMRMAIMDKAIFLMAMTFVVFLVFSWRG